jgi:glutaredoxin-like YruB-family protein
MKPSEVTSHKDLVSRINRESRAFLLIYKQGSDLSDAAYRNIIKATEQVEDVSVYTADVNRTRDIHPLYHINSAPVLIEFEKGNMKNVIKGAHDHDYYRSVFEQAVFIAKAEKEGKPVRQVTVYTTPTCSWCNTLKSYLRKNMIRFTEIDVSRNESAALEMQRRSGQQGVPQTLINGEIVVGFDQARINRLLGIEA